MTYTYESSEQQWIEFQLFQLQRKYRAVTFRTAKKAALVLLDLVFAADIFLTLFLHLENTVNTVLLLSAVFVLINYYLVPQFFYSPKRAAKKCRTMLQKNPNLFIRQKTTCKIEDGTLTLSEECGIISVIPVRLLHGTAETPNSIFIYTEPGRAELVPKSIFSTTEEKCLFLEALKN